MCQTGKKHINRQQITTQQHVSVHYAVIAISVSIPPFVIYPRCLPSVAYALGDPENSLYSCSEKGYMTTELFKKWLDHFIKYERPLVLIMEQHETRCSREEQN